MTLFWGWLSGSSGPTLTRAIPAGSLATFGPLRLIEDVLWQPGHLIFEGERLREIHLNELHPYAAVTAAGLERLFDHFGQP